MAAATIEEQDFYGSVGDTNHMAQTSTKAQMSDLVIHRLIDYDEMDLLCPISYLYNCLPSLMQWLKPQPVSVPNSIAVALRKRRLETSQWNPNSIRLRPFEAGLPIHTGLTQFRQSKHWKTSARAGDNLLRLFARDPQCTEVMVAKGQSIAGQASKQIAASAINTYGRFIIHMGAEADSTRAQLLTQSMVLVFIFDDMWELISTSEKMNQLRDRFVAQLAGNLPVTATEDPLEAAMRDLREGFLRCDEERGNGGRDVLRYLTEFYEHPTPPTFTSVRDYLDYRFEDAGIVYVYSCAKFSIGSSVDLDNPKLRTLLRHIGDQICFANDIASYAKEKRSYENGEAADIINVVHVIAQNEGSGDEQAKCIAYAGQLWMENQISVEINRLYVGGLLDLEEWALVDACLLAASGNLLTSVIIPRYGGEKIKQTEAT
ncbi:MAG: hypothetical protein Q9212_006574 [Teloschistes hypoglaucus]